jgi:Peptidase M50B-like
MTTWTGIVGGLVLTVGPFWRYLGNYLIIIVHEAGHALLIVLYGGRVTGIRVYSRTTAHKIGKGGATYGESYGHARVPVSLAGYLAPSVVGLGTLALLHSDRAKVPLVLLVGVLALMLLMIRNLFGFVIVPFVGGGLYAALQYGSRALQEYVLGVIAWALLFGAVRSAFSAFYDCGDANNLKAVTGVPARMWTTLFILGTSAAAGYASWLTLTGWGG